MTIAAALAALIGAFAALILALSPATALGDSCGSPPGGFKDIKTKHMGCRSAVEVARLSYTPDCIQLGCNVQGFHCNARHGQMTCKKGRKKVTYKF